MRQEIRFAGTGGQGLVSASIVLAEALGVVKDYHVVQTQFYDGHITGGKSSGDVVFGDEKIGFPWVRQPDLLMVMAQDAVRYAPLMRPGTKVVADDIMVTDISGFPAGVSIYWAPLTKLADEVGFRKSANIVALGVLSRLTGLLSRRERRAGDGSGAPRRPNKSCKALEVRAPDRDRTPLFRKGARTSSPLSASSFPSFSPAPGRRSF